MIKLIYILKITKFEMKNLNIKNEYEILKFKFSIVLLLALNNPIKQNVRFRK